MCVYAGGLYKVAIQFLPMGLYYNNYCDWLLFCTLAPSKDGTNWIRSSNIISLPPSLPSNSLLKQHLGTLDATPCILLTNQISKVCHCPFPSIPQQKDYLKLRLAIDLPTFNY